MRLPKPQNLAMIVGLSFLGYTSPAQGLFPDSLHISTAVTSLNLDYLEFSPTFYEQGLLFVTSKRQSKKHQRYFDIAYAPFGENGDISEPTFFNSLNTKYHEGPLAVSLDQHSVFITRSNLKNGKPITDSMGLNCLDIYEVLLSEKEAEERLLGFNSQDFCNVHPALAHEDSLIYFSSNRPGGYGGYDIWLSKKEDGKWQQPTNLGAKVNTPHNELFPYVFKDSLLFFASNRPVRDTSDLDLYQCTLSENGMAVSLQRLPSPINSMSDDFGIILDESGSFGYFTSNRLGSDDIFRYDIIWPARIQTVHFELSVLAQKQIKQGLSTERPVANATISLLLDKQSPIVSHTDSKGYVAFDVLPNEYELVFSKENYKPYTETITVQKGASKRIYVTPKSKPCVARNGTVSSMDLTENLDGVSITVVPDVEHLPISATSDSYGQFSFCLPPACKGYELQAQKKGFMAYTIYLKKDDTPKISLIPVENGRVKQTIVLENIYYDFNDSKIKESSADELVRLAQILKEHPSINILLVAYTDSRGTKTYNERLARHRARTAKAFLVNLGIDPKRIKPVGRGEVNIRNRCKNGVDCSEEEHRYNRRTEVVFRNHTEELQLVRQAD